ncbi:MAG TPA: adenylate/guanylate cyclase domain-containing protein [Actinomycetota bacterium]|nr:adenylate/guanylate cyclase domain-containing protein [Actinomycetota bacterium]
MGMSLEEVADRAGVEPSFVRRVVRSGVLEAEPDGTFSDGDVRRARVLEGLERAGLPLETIAEAVGRGELQFASLDRPVYDRFAELSASSFREVSERDEIPLEPLLVLREAMGFAQAGPDDRMREDELRVVPLIRLQLSKGFDPATIEPWLRVYGDALRRIAETEADWWHTQISVPKLAAGMTEAEVQEISAEWGDEFDALVDQALLAIYHAQQEHTWTENLIEEIESALDRAGLRASMRTTPAICFLDIAGFTDLVEERGDQAATDVATRLMPLVTRLAERHGGKVVKWLGDGVMLHFARAEHAVAAALDMREAVADTDLPPAHIGIHSGPVVFQGGDYFGRTVNLAARIADHAQPGQVLVSDDVARSVGSGRFAFAPIGPVGLKGVSGPVRLNAVARRS